MFYNDNAKSRHDYLPFRGRGTAAVFAKNGAIVNKQFSMYGIS